MAAISGLPKATCRRYLAQLNEDENEITVPVKALALQKSEFDLHEQHLTGSMPVGRIAQKENSE
jgi:hypothetical protein